NWREEDGIITWDNYSWGGGEDIPEKNAITFYRYKVFRDFLRDYEFENGLEIGSGYGRITPYISLHCESLDAIEPNDDLRGKSASLYPHIDFFEYPIQDNQLPANNYDLVVTQAVLHHIPPNEIKDAAKEIKRVSKKGALLLLMEDVGDSSGDSEQTHYWVRQPSFYEELLSPFNLKEVLEVNLPFRKRENRKKLMVFKKDNGYE
ncbi:MAG: class I SAM-dependent methyltransferase, partial [Candidatus Aenigmatarchaeota archaeon]